ncbi:hypothetical protein CHF27_008435 [Romboutsia maritimum]|uniref:Uncharacterized protein n=1 Tax=Romboutsia maritimum TaxID=2020948 RepID=A0A371ISC2_9FIRM|nr:hypothetical protein [Romboutsia maritimum]RDY23381.1 hypothetical protein CHF27_008435 [Romboutsia maritimum]
MQDLKKNKRRMINNQASITANKLEAQESMLEEGNRGCKHKPSCSDICHDEKNCCNNKNDEKFECDCICSCTCKKQQEPDCEPCQIESDECIKNVCGPECCDPITIPRFSPANSVPIAIETNRIFDTMQFQTFTDAVDEDGAPIEFVFDVIEVNGAIPMGSQVNVTIDEICLNHDGIQINPGIITLEDYDLEPDEPQMGKPCETKFEYSVCGQRNATCCSQGKNRNLGYKQRGLTATVSNLVLELRGRCGCTKFVALAFPALNGIGGARHRCDKIQFRFNTLSAPICVPADGRSFILRQNFKTSLTVDCIEKALLCCECCEGERYCELDIPNGIDLILCLQETVSTLINDQLVVLGSPNSLNPRIVDSFTQVCNFSKCGVENNNNNKGKGCGCNR